MGEGEGSVAKLTRCEESGNESVTREWKHWKQESAKSLSRVQEKIGGIVRNCPRRNRTFRMEAPGIPTEHGQHVRWAAESNIP